MAIPDSKKIYPRIGDTQIVYLKNVIENPNIEIGDYTIYNDFIHGPRDFQKNNVGFVLIYQVVCGGIFVPLKLMPEIICERQQSCFDYCLFFCKVRQIFGWCLMFFENYD